MFNRIAIAKLKAILIVDLIIVAFAVGGYFYVQSTFERPKAAAFVLSDLTINPIESQINQPIEISVNVTNIGTEPGNYSLGLLIDDELVQSQEIQLSGAESTVVKFTVEGQAEGSHSIAIDELTGTFIVSTPQPPPDGNGGEPADIKLSSMKFNPNEGWPGVATTVSVQAENPGSSPVGTSVSFYVGNDLIDTKQLTVPSGLTVMVRFTWTPPSEGSYAVKVAIAGGGDYLTQNFKVVPNGYHTLSVKIYPSGNADFTVDGTPYTTPYTALFTAGSHTIAVEASDPTGTNLFIKWEDGSTDPTRRLSLNSAMSITAFFTGGESSCPSVYVWNGTTYDYVAEMSNHGWLGYTRYVNADGSLEYWRNNPWDYIPLNNFQLQPINGGVNMKLQQRYDEIFFIDEAYMVVVDHPSGTSVYSTMVEQYIDPEFMGQIYTVSNDRLKPVSAFNEIITIYDGKVTDSAERVDALSQILERDGVFTSGFNGKYSPAWNNQTWNRITLDLGDLDGSQQIKLIVTAIVDWGEDESYNLWMNKFYSTTVPDHTEPTPVPFMEVKDANGNWVRVPESRQFPLPPDKMARTFVVDLTGLFPTNDYSLRINNFWNVTFDYFGIDTSTQQDMIVQTIDAQAYLYQDFVPTEAGSSGSFTRYGDVTDLLLNFDDRFVIGRKGDAISLQFPLDNIAAPAEGMKRDYFFFGTCWFKVRYANYGFGPGHDGFTVDPLPFHNMSGFPYPLDEESYPFSSHSSYLEAYNTRVITLSQPPQEASFAPWVIAVVIIIVVVNLGIAAYSRKRSR